MIFNVVVEIDGHTFSSRTTADTAEEAKSIARSCALLTFADRIKVLECRPVEKGRDSGDSG